jgi:stage V sporulation protein S
MSVLQPKKHEKLIKVSSKSNLQAVAGSISHSARNGVLPIIWATGIDSVNKSVKAIAIARRFLSYEKIYLDFEPIFRSELAVTFVANSLIPPPDHKTEPILIAKSSTVRDVAGAIAKRVRINQPVILRGIGPLPVWLAINAIACAKFFLERDLIDLSFRSEFVKLQLAEGERSAIQFLIVVHRLKKA